MRNLKLFIAWLAVFLVFVCIDSGYKNKQIMAGKVQLKLNRKTLHNLQWEVAQAHSRNRELDMMRWYHRQTKLWHGEWAEILETVYTMAAKYKIRPELVMSIIHRESYFSTTAFSNAGAVGLMQVNYPVWKDELNLTEISVMDITINIDAGCYILRQYLDEAGGDEIQALIWYNCGYRLQNVNYVPRIKSSIFYGGKK